MKYVVYLHPYDHKRLYIFKEQNIQLINTTNRV